MAKTVLIIPVITTLPTSSEILIQIAKVSVSVPVRAIVAAVTILIARQRHWTYYLILRTSVYS